MIADTHCHLHMDYYNKDRDEVVKRMQEQDFSFALTVGVSVEDSKGALALSEKWDFIYCTVGIHPHDAKSFSEDVLVELERLAKNSKVLAIGETGLDFYRNLSPKEDQYRAFEAQLDLAQRLDLPVVIHTRDATKETKEVLKRFAGARGVIHCFSGDLKDARDFLDMGFLISFAGHLTYPKNHDLRKVACYVPEDMLFVETDAPFLTPVPLRGKRNEPLYIKYTYMKLAEIRGIDYEDLLHQVCANVQRLFGVDF